MRFREIENPEKRLESLALVSEEEKEERRKRNASITMRMNNLLFSDDEIESKSHSEKKEGASF